MNILSVIEAFAHGGAETVLMDLVSGLDEHRHRVVHFSAANHVPAHTPFVAALASAGVPCVDAHWSGLTDPASRRRLLENFDADVVLFHWWGNDPWLPWISSAAGQAPHERPAFVCVLHNSGIQPPPGYDRYVTVAPNQSQHVSHVPHERVLMIPNGVNLHRFLARNRRLATL